MSDERNHEVVSENSKASTWRKWGSLILGGTLLFLCGLEVGAEAIRAKQRDTEELLRQATAKVEDATQSVIEARIQAERFKKAYILTIEQMDMIQKELIAERNTARLEQPGQSSTFTVLYEAGNPALNISLLPLRGAPRISLLGAPLGPRWIVPGRIQPEVFAETQQAIYYFYDARNSTWQGPFGPKRVVQ